MKNACKVLMLAIAVTVPAGEFYTGTANAETASAPVMKIADIYKKKDSLDKKQVTVKGKVVKVASGIMKRNWIHIQDGSGKASSKDNDLTVTSTKDLPTVGQVVTATGTLAKNKDFGAGYFYTVIVEGATIK